MTESVIACGWHVAPAHPKGENWLVPICINSPCAVFPGTLFKKGQAKTGQTGLRAPLLDLQ